MNLSEALRMKRELQLICSGDIGSEARKRGVDLFATLSVYNFDFWFDGSRAILVLSEEEPQLAVVSVDGEYAVYASSRNHSCSELEDRLAEALGLREDLSSFYALASRDPLLRGFAESLKGWRLRSSSLWWALVVGVCQQNASFRQGWLMLRRIVLSYGNSATIGSETIPLPPSPRMVLEDPQRLSSARVGYRASTIERIARAIQNGDISEELLESLPPRDAEAVLRRVRGVGSYTARLGMALGLRIYDLPPIDRWVRALASRAYSVDEKRVEDEWIRRWGRWSALAVIALTIALDAEPLRRALERVSKGDLAPHADAVPTPLNLWRWRPRE